MDIKTKIEEYLDRPDILYIDIFMVNGVTFNIYKPLQPNTLNIETKDDYLRIYGDVNEENSIDTAIPYEHITHITAAFGEQDNITNKEVD